jgi:hypothetical protein
LATPLSLVVVPASVPASEPPELPAQWPAVPFLELHVSPDGQELPPLPRQPVSHRLVVVLQTRPELALPQSESIAQPQVPFARHAAPTPPAWQFCVCFGVQAAQWFVALQTSPVGQSGSFRHAAQTWG